ncbi:MAG: DNA polymerase [Pelagibacteraceae bacterium TMED247]|nr:MAG: DNA polymerase [Pelagibacteraceae bacterium TMED247]|tara:strand:- start:11951 stop:12619 length:669 start_codon:yes stop_codon:yes gene_type:complete
MNISNETLDILRNFSSINSGITVKSGNELVTVSAMKNIFAKAVVDENFEKDHSIYDLSEYLGAVSLFDKPNFEFNAEKVTVSEGDNSVIYYYADPQMVISPTKEITMPEPEITFDLDKDVLDSLLKASSVLSLPDMVLSSDGQTVVLTVKDKKNSTSNVFSKTVAQGNGSTFEMFLRMENMKMIPGDYTAFVSSKGIGHFTNRNTAVEYFIALEPDSTYEAV